MAAACGPNGPKLDFKLIINEEEKEIRPYFLIGNEDASEDEIETLCDKMKSIAHPILINNPDIAAQKEHYQNFNLPDNFKGFALLVHSDDDTGMNVLQTYRAIQAVERLDVAPSAHNTGSRLATEVWNRQQEIACYLNLEPHLEGIEQLVKELKPSSEELMPFRESRYTAIDQRTAVEAQFAGITKLEEEISSLELIVQMMGNTHPDKAHAVYNLQMAQCKLGELQR